MKIILKEYFEQYPLPEGKTLKSILCVVDEVAYPDGLRIAPTTYAKFGEVLQVESEWGEWILISYAGWMRDVSDREITGETEVEDLME